MYADSSGPEFQSAIELGCEMALPFPFLDVMLVKKLQIQLSSPGKLPKKREFNIKSQLFMHLPSSYLFYCSMKSEKFHWFSKQKIYIENSILAIFDKSPLCEFGQKSI